MRNDRCIASIGNLQLLKRHIIFDDCNRGLISPIAPKADPVGLIVSPRIGLSPGVVSEGLSPRGPQRDEVCNAGGLPRKTDAAPEKKFAFVVKLPNPAAAGESS